MIGLISPQCINDRSNLLRVSEQIGMAGFVIHNIILDRYETYTYALLCLSSGSPASFAGYKSAWEPSLVYSSPASVGMHLKLITLLSFCHQLDAPQFTITTRTILTGEIYPSNVSTREQIQGTRRSPTTALGRVLGNPSTAPV